MPAKGHSLIQSLLTFFFRPTPGRDARLRGTRELTWEMNLAGMKVDFQGWSCPPRQSVSQSAMLKAKSRVAEYNSFGIEKAIMITLQCTL